MQLHPRLFALDACHHGPMGAARLPRRNSAGTSRNAVKDRPIQGLVDDLVCGGHGRQSLFSNAVVLADQLRRVAFERTSLLNGNAA